ncbi:MAG: hypothetical protein ACLTK0_06435 [Anaerovoracaceae bacterium]
MIPAILFIIGVVVSFLRLLGVWALGLPISAYGSYTGLSASGYRSESAEVVRRPLLSYAILPYSLLPALAATICSTSNTAPYAITVGVSSLIGSGGRFLLAFAMR